MRASDTLVGHAPLQQRSFTASIQNCIKIVIFKMQLHKKQKDDETDQNWNMTRQMMR